MAHHDRLCGPRPREARREARLHPTTFEGYAATVTSALGVSAAALVALGSDSTAWLLAGVSVVLAAVTPALAGLASYLSIVSRGIPDDYQA